MNNKFSLLVKISVVTALNKNAYFKEIFDWYSFGNLYRMVNILRSTVSVIITPIYLRTGNMCMSRSSRFLIKF